ncbi:MAG TPA: FtsX-like permease family protein, partial [Arachidicoccus sp.]|nr:FtsX-like permease family protein [Arachidicoccus sp.]
PLIIDNRGFKNILYVRTTAANAPQAIEATERLYKKYSGNAPFSYYFLDSTFENKYRSQQNSTLLFRIFSGITLFISSLGLLGLATYSAAVKTKEIGVRKVMGASVGSIIQLIAKDFLKLVLLAIILGVPIAYLGMSKWMDHFAYRIGIGNWTFLIGAFVVVLIALITIGTITFKAARANPVESLRSE